MKINFQNKKKLIIIIYCLLQICLILSPAITYLSSNKISRYIVMLLLSGSIFIIIIMTFFKIGYSDKINKQFFEIYLILFLFLISYTVNYIRNFKYVAINQNIYIMTFAYISANLFFWGRNIQWNKRNLLENFKKNKMLICFLILYVFLCMETMISWTNWDSKEYYRYISNLKSFSFSPNDIRLFKAAGHMSYGYMFFMGIGEFLLPDYGIGPRLINIVFVCFSVVFLYKILSKKFNDKKLNILATIIFALTPTICGPLYEQNVEYILLSTFIFCVYFFLEKKYVALAFWGTILVFTKETAVVAFLGLAIGYSVCEVVKNKNLKCFFDWQHLKNILAYYIPCFIFLIYYLLDSSGWANNIRSDGSSSFNKFGYNSIIFWGKNKQLFLMNFQWIVSLILIIAILITLFEYKKRANNNYHSLLPIIFSYVLFLISQMFYITYLLPRYILLQYFYSIFFLVWFLQGDSLIKIMLKKALYIVPLLFVVQTYFSFDPVTLNCFPNVKIGNSKMAVACLALSYDDKTIITGKDAEVMLLSPVAQSNRQYLYKYRLMEKTLKEINYTKNDLIIFPDVFSPISNGTYWGYKSENYFDKENGYIYQFYEPYSANLETEYFERVNYYIVNNSQYYDIDLYDNVYFIDYPYNKTVNVDEYLSPYDVTEHISMSYRGWTAEVYKIK